MKIKKNLILLFCSSVLIFSCTKTDNTINVNDSYGFDDLALTDNLIDSVIILGSLRTAYKFKYSSKNTISYIGLSNKVTTYDPDTLLYGNNNILSYNYRSPLFNISNKVKFVYSNSLLSRIYQYEDDYFDPKQRQLGSYISYTNNQVTQTLYRFINQSSLTRDSSITYIKRNLQNDIDSVQSANNPNPSFKRFELKFFYSTIVNKFKGNANLKELAYMYLYKPIDFDFFAITGYSGNIDYLYLDQIFADVLFNSSYLPSSFEYNRGSILFPQMQPVYFKYKFNSNGYVTSISMASTSSFNQDLSERIQITFYKKP